jgi:hypothetical protein
MMSTVTLSDDLYQMLEPIARSLGMTVDQLVEMWVRENLTPITGPVMNDDDFLQALHQQKQENAKPDAHL